MKKIILILIVVVSALGASAQLTLDYCLSRAEENYPLIKKYDLINASENLSLSDINRGWLPRIGVFAQATAQSDVTTYPQALRQMLDKTGASVEGMSRLQYEAGVAVTQPIWDGGHSRGQRGVERAEASRSRAALEVELYALHERVENIYFSLLLMEARAEKLESTAAVLASNHERLQSMVKSGVATGSDADMVEAQLLTVRQQVTEIESAARAARRLLGIYIGEEIAGRSLQWPDAELPADMTPARPELALFDRETEVNDRRMALVDVALMPRVSLFARAWYGYPGLNMLESIMKREASLNAVAGIKISWNIDSFYTSGTARRRLAVASTGNEVQRDVFLFNNRLKSSRELEEIDGLRKVIAEDSRIVDLRESVRRAAESQLSHGIIDITALLSKIDDENQARMNSTLHKIQLLQTIHQLKYTLNR